MPGDPRRDHPPAGTAVRVPVRPRRVPGHRGGRSPGGAPPRGGRQPGRGDPCSAGRRVEPGPRPHPAGVPGADPGHAAHQLLRRHPARRPWRDRGPTAGRAPAPEALCVVQARPQRDPGPARAAPAVRDLRLLTACRGRAPALRQGRPGRAAMERPPGGLPHRGSRAGQGADGQERRDRPDRGQGRLLLQEPARPGRGPRGLARRGDPLLPHVHLRSARRDGQPRRGRGHRRAPRRPPATRRPPRRGRHLPRRGRGQGDGDVLRHRQLGGQGLRLLAVRRLRLRRLGRLRPQGDGHHREGGVGERQASFPRARPRRPERGLHRRRHRGHERRRLRQRHAALTAHPAGGRVRPPAHLPRPRPGPADLAGRTAAAVRAAPLVVGRLRHLPDLAGRRGVPARGEVGQDLGAGRRSARPDAGDHGA